jgi:hypothetical protein
MTYLDDIEDMLLPYPAGKVIVDLVHKHIEEIMTLINYNKAATVVWHRNKGPAFFGYIIKSGKETDFHIPAEYEGVKIQTLIRRLGATLQEHGSSQLRLAVGQHIAAFCAAA